MPFPVMILIDIILSFDFFQSHSFIFSWLIHPPSPGHHLPVLFNFNNDTQTDSLAVDLVY